MRDLRERIHIVGAAEIEWPFRGEPCFKTKGPTTYARSHPVDPFPCYSHDRDLTAACCELTEAAFPVANQVDYFITEYEEVGRTNGYADKTDAYDKSNKKSHWEPIIVLLGKRIPPHPAMTRYLVPHEFGHIAQWWIEKVRGIDSNCETTDLDREYMSLRPGTHNEYGGKKWHSNVGELIANDFRILVCGAEEEFWPHPGFPHPRDEPSVQEFWERAVADVEKAENA